MVWKGRVKSPLSDRDTPAVYTGCFLSSIRVLKTRSRNMISKKGGKHQVPICWAMNPKITGVSMILALEKAISIPIID